MKARISLVLVVPFLAAPGCPQEDACTTVETMEKYYDSNLHLDLDDDTITCTTTWQDDCVCITLTEGECNGLAFVGDNAYECQEDWNNQHGSGGNDDGDGIKLQLSNIESWVEGVQLWCYNYTQKDWSDWYQGLAAIDNEVPSSRELTGWFSAGVNDAIQCNGCAWANGVCHDLVHRTESGYPGSYATLSVVEGNQKYCSATANGTNSNDEDGGFNYFCRR